MTQSIEAKLLSVLVASGLALASYAIVASMLDDNEIRHYMDLVITETRGKKDALKID